jgi:hypothetical protein
LSEAENGARSPLEGVRVIEMVSLLADFGAGVIKVPHNYAVYGKVLCLGEARRDGLCERGII